jgi:arabinose-5-phosphate isomerase
LGRRLSRVDDLMRPLDQCRVARDDQTVRQVIVACTKPGRRTGAIMLTDAAGRLTGLFTDSDLARLFERRDEAALDRPICGVMAANPTMVLSGARVRDAVALLAQRKFSEIPVVDAAGRPIGLIDVTDVVGLKAEATEEKKSTTSAKGNVRVFPNKGAA